MVRKYKLTGVRDGLVCMYRCVWRGTHTCVPLRGMFQVAKIPGSAIR